MKPNPLPPIPSPPARRWHRFRVQVVPYLAFGVVLGATIWLWGKNLANPLLTGTAEGLQADVSSPKSGRLAQLKVAPYQEVKAGDVIAVVDAVDPRVLSNKLAVIRSEIELLRVSLSPVATQQRNAINYAQLRLNWMKERAELAIARANLQLHEVEFHRYEEAFNAHADSEEKRDIARAAYQASQHEVQELTTLVSECEQSIKSLQVTNAADLSIISDTPLRAAIAVQEANLRLAEAELQPIVLTSPITGTVSKIDKLEGSTVGANDPIVTVASPKVDYILGYVGQPLRIEPVLGMKVEVRSRGLNRTVTYARITHIGSQIELFNAPLRARGMGNAQERGLPIAVSVPADLKLRPGELVDITLSSKND